MEQDLTHFRRDMFFRIINGEKDFHPIALRLHFLNDHFPDQKLDRALKWLVTNRIVGRAFNEWYKLQCSGSDLEMHARLLVVADNAAIVPIIAGKNFRV